MIAALAIAAMVAAALYLSRPGRSVSTALAELNALNGTLTLTPEQQEVATLIAELFASGGAGWAAPAAVANAYAESRLDPLAIGDGGASVGLFQLHADGAGAGLSVEARQDPRTNTLRILQVALSEPEFTASYGQTHAEVTRAFAQWVERCAACGWPLTTELGAREGWLRKLYGDALADTEAT